MHDLCTIPTMHTFCSSLSRPIHYFFITVSTSSLFVGDIKKVLAFRFVRYLQYLCLCFTNFFSICLVMKVKCLLNSVLKKCLVKPFEDQHICHKQKLVWEVHGKLNNVIEGQIVGNIMDMYKKIISNIDIYTCVNTSLHYLNYTIKMLM